MNKYLMYIERYTGTNHNGEAWISYVKKSKSGKTIYFNGKALKNVARGSYFDIETFDNYWITGVKKRGTNRHRFGSGKIMIEKSTLNEFMLLKGIEKIDKVKYDIVEIEDMKQEEIQRLSIIENRIEPTIA